MDAFERAKRELEIRGTVTLSLLDTLTPHSRADLKGALDAMVESGWVSFTPPETWTVRQPPQPLDGNATALLTLLAHRPRTIGDLERAVSWSPNLIREKLRELVDLGLAVKEASFYTATAAGLRHRGYDVPPSADSSGRSAAAQGRRDANASLAMRSLVTPQLVLEIAMAEDGKQTLLALGRIAYGIADAMEAAR